jgi:hypothetical protein
VSDLFILIQEDSHADVDATVYRRKDAAVDAARGILFDCGGKVEDLNPAMLKQGWVFYGTYGEDEMVRVVRTQLKG